MNRKHSGCVQDIRSIVKGGASHHKIMVWGQKKGAACIDIVGHSGAAEQAVNITLTYYHLTKLANISKQLPINTSSRHRARLAYF